ncbi:MAG: hypothetical protein JWO73_713 [Candidatus Taylorbacteria bacterium]|nr:hypothetical protein [Candidatus Taylorbacteria bacterium]
MQISTQKTADRIVKILLLKPNTASEISRKLKEHGFYLSVSGLYKALKQLEAADIAIRSKGIFSISSEWKKAMSEMLTQHDISPEIEEGESMAFEVSSASQMDKLWKHYMFILERDTEGAGIYFYGSHNFWIRMPDRKKSEEDFIAYTKKRRMIVCHTIGYPSRFDKNFARKHKSDTYQIHFESVPTFSHLDNITLFGDYILNTKIDEKLFKLIDDAYRNAKDDAELMRMIESAVQQKHRYKLKLERNKNKAERLRKRLGTHFVIK